MTRRVLLLLALATVVLALPVSGAAAPDAPTLSSVSPASPANNNTPTLSGTAPAGTTVTIYTQSGCGGSGVASGPADGTTGAFAIQVTVLDNSENTFSANASDGTDPPSACSADLTYTEDSTPPPTPTISGPTGTVNSNDATFTFAVEAGATYTCQVDTGTQAPCAGSASYSNLPDGQRTFTVVATDAAGNSSQASSTWTIDTTPPPKPTILTAPADPSASAAATFTFSDTEPGATFVCRLDGGSFDPCTSPTSYSNLDDGPHTFSVKALDAVGNDSAVASYHWKVDTVNPVVELTDKPPLLTNRTTASFSFVANKPATAYECALDGGLFAPCTSPRVYTGLGNGSHTFAVRAIGLAIPGPTTEYTWTIDTVSPQTTIAGHPPASATTGSATFTFTSSEAGSGFVCSVDSAGFAPCTTPKSYVGLGDGSHTFRVQAVDAAGNADATPATYTWTITKTGPPTVDLVPPGEVGGLQRTVGYGKLRLRWQRPADADFDHVTVLVSTRAGTVPRTRVYSGTASTYTDKKFKNGSYYRYLVVAHDHVGNASHGRSTVVRASALLRLPRDGATVRTAPRFAWTPVARASFYNLQLYRGSRKVLSVWPTRPRQALRKHWTYAGASVSLRKGRYVWYVWPGFGPKARSRYGALLGQASFTVR